MDSTKIILGAGKYQRQEGWQTLDQFAFDGIDIVHNLNNQFPLESSSITELSAIHVVEHLENLVNFMDECHRVLIPGGSLYIETPEAGTNPDLQFADPTHVRCYRKHTFINYFTLAGIEAFGYTNKAWAILHIEAKDGILIFHGQPIK